MGAAASVKHGDLLTATYTAFGRVAPAEYFDGEVPAKQAVSLTSRNSRQP